MSEAHSADCSGTVQPLSAKLAPAQPWACLKAKASIPETQGIPLAECKKSQHIYMLSRDISKFACEHRTSSEISRIYSPRQMLKKRQSHNIQRDTSKKACKCTTSSLLSRPRPIQKRKKKRKNAGNMTGGGPPCNLIPWHRQSHSRPAASFHTLSKSSCPQHHPNGLLPLAIYFYFSRYACP